MKRKLTAAVGSLVVGFGLLAASTTASAVLQTQTFLDTNDCSGEFGTGFENCVVNGSPIIVKFGAGEGGAIEVNSIFPTIDGSEFTFTPDPLSGTSGTWTYEPNDPEDPAIRYWVAKGGNDFNLFWDGTAALASATIQTSNVWFTPGQGLSHLSFYDTISVSEPGVLGLLGLGLVMAGFMRRRKTA